MTTFKTFSNTVRDLNKATNITKDDYFVTYSSNDGKAKKQKVEELHIPYKIASFDNYDDFNDFLDANFHTLTYPNGKYRIDIGGVPTYVTFEVRSASQKVYGMWVESPAEPKDGKLKLFGNNAAVHFCSRVYSDGNWADWKELAYSVNIPTVQKMAEGTQYNYIYSKKGSNAFDASFAVLNGKFRMYQNSGHVKLQHQGWGSTSNISTDDTYVYTINCDISAMANSSAPGFMSSSAYNWLNSFTLTTPSDKITQESVTITYPILGTTNYRKELKIDKATSAQAGLMTSEHYGIVEDVKKGMKIYKGLSDRNTALQKLDDISICSDESIFLIQCTYRDSANNSSSICLQHIDGKYCHQTLFDSKAIKQRVIEFSDISRNEIYNKGNFA